MSQSKIVLNKSWIDSFQDVSLFVGKIKKPFSAMTRVFCDRQKCDPQFVRLSDPTFVRPTTKKQHLSDLRLKMRRLSDLGLKHNVCPTRCLSELTFAQPNVSLNIIKMYVRPSVRLSVLTLKFIHLKSVLSSSNIANLTCPSLCLWEKLNSHFLHWVLFWLFF